jgi:hypothetical protein
MCLLGCNALSQHAVRTEALEALDMCEVWVRVRADAGC